jgi:gluconokinase
VSGRDPLLAVPLAPTGYGDSVSARPVPVVVMGVSGSGKTTVGTALARRLGRRFVEGDQLHPPQNIAKMRRGEPLDDADRAPWLDLVADGLARDPDVVVSCSALRRAYRDRLRRQVPDLLFVHVSVPDAVLRERVESRQGHWMPASLLSSQLETLEPLQPDERGVVVDGTEPVDEVVDQVVAALAHALTP